MNTERSKTFNSLSISGSGRWGNRGEDGAIVIIVILLILGFIGLFLLMALIVGAIVLYVLVNLFHIGVWDWWMALALGLCIVILTTIIKPTYVKKVYHYGRNVFEYEED